MSGLLCWPCLALAACACQTAQKPVSLLPPGKAPALKPTYASGASSDNHFNNLLRLRSGGCSAAKASAHRIRSLRPTLAPTPASDAVADLIARVEKEYQAGLANHQAGKTEEAKQNFDNALNALLSSNLDIRSDDRLQKEFDRIVAGVNQLYPGRHRRDRRRGRSRNPSPRRSTRPTALLPPPTPASKPRRRPKSRTPIPTCR